MGEKTIFANSRLIFYLKH